MQVFSARAEVFPQSPIGFRRSTCLLRTRGGVPHPRDTRPRRSWSSPHARRCSREPEFTDEDRAVFSARAEVFPPTPHTYPLTGCLLRTRGGVPVAETLTQVNLESSPHARRCSGPRRCSSRHPRVFSARAEVFPSSPPSQPRSPRLLRTRGGVPKNKATSGSPLASSPHARRCSLLQHVVGDDNAVFSARAEVFRELAPGSRP